MVKKPRKNSSVRRKDMGVVSALLVLSQAVSSYLPSKSVSKDIEELKQSINSLRTERERDFVRKDEFRLLASKLDRLDEKLSHIKRDIKGLDPKETASTDFSLNAGKNLTARLMDRSKLVLPKLRGGS